MGNERLKDFLAGLSIFLVILALFVPVGLVYALIIHFTGQYYASIIILVLFLLLFCYIDIGISTLIEGFLQAAKERYDGLYMPKLVGNLLEFCGTLIVLSALDYFMNGIELSFLIKLVIALIHEIASLFLEGLETGEEVEGPDLAPEVMNDIHHCLRQASWTDCVAMMHEKYPHIPKGEIIRAVRKVYIDSKKGSSV